MTPVLLKKFEPQPLGISIAAREKGSSRNLFESAIARAKEPISVFRVLLLCTAASFLNNLKVPDCVAYVRKRLGSIFSSQ